MQLFVSHLIYFFAFLIVYLLKAFPHIILTWSVNEKFENVIDKINYLELIFYTFNILLHYFPIIKIFISIMLDFYFECLIRDPYTTNWLQYLIISTIWTKSKAITEVAMLLSCRLACKPRWLLVRTRLALIYATEVHRGVLVGCPVRTGWVP